MEFKGTKKIHLLNIDSDNVQWAEGEGDNDSEVNYIRADIAQDMLEALQGLIDQIGCEHVSEFMDDHLMKAEAAIKKALGT